MTYERRESYRKWATLIVSMLVLLVTSLRDPLVLVNRHSEYENLRRELARYELAPGPSAKMERDLDVQPEVLRRLDGNVAKLRDEALASEGNHKLLVEINNCLQTVETKLDLLMKERQRERQQLGVESLP